MTIQKFSGAMNFPNPTTGNIISVPHFFKGKDVFVTGATGFMGKVLIEKLLWSCEDIGNVYILVRVKKGVSVESRIAELIALPVFDRIRERDPKVLSKIIPIPGDVIVENLGISDEHRKLLQSNVSIVFHAASSVRFDDPLKKAILLNVRGTRDIMELAKSFKKLKVVNYVSTSYCNSDMRIIEEKVYPSYYDWRFMIKLAESTDDHILNIIQPKILMKKPNTYTFTKHLAENIIKEYSTEIPSIIFRPSIVTFSINEPLPGWVDNLNGPVGIAVGVIMGIIHTVYGDPSCSTDYMPCDFAINGIIIATWYRGILDSKECQVVNGATGSKKKTSLGVVENLSNGAIDSAPPSRSLWYPSFIITKNWYIFYLMTILTHLLPGAIIDVVLRLKGINFSLLRLYRKVFIANQALSYFMVNDWKIVTDNYISLPKLLSTTDKENFRYDMSEVDEAAAMAVGQMGVKKYIFKEDVSESAMAKARTNFKRLFWLHYTARILMVVLLAWLFINFTMKYF